MATSFTLVCVSLCPSSSLSKNHIDDQSGNKLLEALIGCSYLEELL